MTKTTGTSTRKLALERFRKLEPAKLRSLRAKKETQETGHGRTASQEQEERKTTFGPETGRKIHPITRAGVTLTHKGVVQAPGDLEAEVARVLDGGLTVERLGKLLSKTGDLDVIRAADPDLADTLSLFIGRLSEADGLSKEKLLQAAVNHHRINTDAASLEHDVSAKEVERDLRAYARDFGFDTVIRQRGKVYAVTGDTRIALGKLSDGDVPASTLQDLGRALNYATFGTEKSIAPKHLPMDETKDSYAAAVMNAQLSGLAYAKPEIVHTVGRAWGFPKLQYVRDRQTDTHAFVLSNDQTSVVAFRGTSSRSNFRTDLQFLKRKALGGKVHTGFHGAMRRVWKGVEEELKRTGNDRVVFTGHSLGGALAQLAAKQYADDGGSVHAVYGFGTPHVGNQQFQDGYDRSLGDRTFSHVYGKDIVARVPPSWLGYADNSGQTRRFDATGDLASGAEQVQVEKDLTGMVELAEQAIGQDANRTPNDEVLEAERRAERKSRIPAVAHHSVANYQGALEALLSG